MWKRMLRVGLPAVLALSIAGLAAACGNDDDDGATQPGALNVLGSTTIIADWIAQVGGEHIEVDSIVPMNTDVHAFVVAPGDIRRIGGADLVFVIGEHLESGFEGEIEANASGRVVVLSEGMTLQRFPETHAHDDGHSDDHAHDDDHDHSDDDGHVHGEFDPHIWMDIGLTVQAVERIRDTLVEMDPENAEDYRENADAYVATLRELDEEIAETLAGLPENQRYIVTFHDAYGYLASRYGLTLLGFVVENPEAQPSASRYAELVDAIRENDVPYIYKEPQFDARVLEQLARDTGAEVRSIPSDALTDETPDYVSLMRAITSGIAAD